MIIDFGRVENVAELFNGDAKHTLQNDVIAPYLTHCRWFSGKAERLEYTDIKEYIPIDASHQYYIIFIDVFYHSSQSRSFIIPLAVTDDKKAEQMYHFAPDAILSRLRLNGRTYIMYDAVYDTDFHKILYDLIALDKHIEGRQGTLISSKSSLFDSWYADHKLTKSFLLKREQSNSSIVYDNHFIVKLFRRLEQGHNCDCEIIKSLGKQDMFHHVPRYGGVIEYHKQDNTVMTIGFLEEFIKDTHDVWQMMLDSVEDFYYRIAGREIPLIIEDMNTLLPGLIGEHTLSRVTLLGKRTAQMHCALAGLSDPGFQPELFTRDDQKLLHDGIISNLEHVTNEIENLRIISTSGITDIFNGFDAIKERVISMLTPLSHIELGGEKIRIHGDYHLGQVLFTNNDFYIIDFEGEPAREPAVRRLKYPCLKDVAGMLRSFHYAVSYVYHHIGKISPDGGAHLPQWNKAWYRYIADTYTTAYLQEVEGKTFLPADRAQLRLLLNIMLLDKSVYELLYELDNRPEWAVIPLNGILSILGETG